LSKSVVRVVSILLRGKEKWTNHDASRFFDKNIIKTPHLNPLRLKHSFPHSLCQDFSWQHHINENYVKKASPLDDELHPC
jgi:hypothetical protein